MAFNSHIKNHTQVISNEAQTSLIYKKYLLTVMINTTFKPSVFNSKQSIK